MTRRGSSDIGDGGMLPHGRHMTRGELAQRWRVTPRTLDRWRAARTGPAWLRLNGRIRYRLEDVLAFEQA